MSTKFMARLRKFFSSAKFFFFEVFKFFSACLPACFPSCLVRIVYNKNSAKKKIFFCLPACLPSLFIIFFPLPKLRILLEVIVDMEGPLNVLNLGAFSALLLEGKLAIICYYFPFNS